MADITDMVTVADFAKEISVTPTTVNGWIEKFNEERDDSFSEGAIVPLATFGNTRVFSRKTLLELAAEKGNSAAVKAAGYVHPDKYAELEQRHAALVLAEAQLAEKYNQLRSTFDDTVDRLTAMEIERDHFEKLSKELQDVLTDQMIDNSDIEE